MNYWDNIRYESTLVGILINYEEVKYSEVFFSRVMLYDGQADSDSGLTYLLTYLCQIVLYEHGSLFNMEEMEKAANKAWECRVRRVRKILEDVPAKEINVLVSLYLLIFIFEIYFLIIFWSQRLILQFK